MKKRYLYSLLFGIPGFFVSLIIALFTFATAAGFLWVFVYGDNTWPASTRIILPVLFIFVLFIIWGGSIFFGFMTGKKLEVEPGLNINHIMLSAIATIIPLALIILYQFNVGNLGPRPDSILCSDYCRAKGYSASSMPPEDTGIRACSCYNDGGKESIKIPIENIQHKSNF